MSLGATKGYQFKSNQVDLYMLAGGVLDCVENVTLFTGDGVKLAWTGEGLPGGQKHLRPGSITITMPYGTGDDVETFTDAGFTFNELGDGVLTGSNGSTFTIDYETAEWELSAAAVPKSGSPVTISVFYTDVDVNDLIPLSELTMKLEGNPDDVNIVTGDVGGALAAPGDFWLSLQGSAYVFNVEWQYKTGISEKIGEVPEVIADQVEVKIQLPKGYRGIYKYNASAAPLGQTPANVQFQVTAWGQTYADTLGSGALTTVDGSGKIDLQTGELTLRSPTSATPAGDIILTQLAYLEPPTIHPVMVATHRTRFEQVEESGTYRGRWYYEPDACSEAAVVGRVQIRGRDCTSGVEHRGYLGAFRPELKADAGGNLMMGFTGLLALVVSRFDIPKLLDDGTPYPSVALPHKGATGSLKARPDLDNAALDKTFNGRSVGNFSVAFPAADPARLTTAWGEYSGGTADVIVNTPTDAKVEASIVLQDLKGADFDFMPYLTDVVVQELQTTWRRSATAKQRVRYELVGYFSELPYQDSSGAQMLGAKIKGVYGRPGDTSAQIGRDRSRPVGRISFEADF